MITYALEKNFATDEAFGVLLERREEASFKASSQRVVFRNL
jgi:hypothetical protein